MAKVFTITEGLENLGALKSGGQGSVYKARRTSDIITAVKILPTPIYSESDEDKNFVSFNNEVQKLKKVNEFLNPNVVNIIASGITNSGNLPYIEMEYIEGPDLAELLKPPYDPVFSIKETIKVAEHLSNALAHCHQANIKHGDIKSNNVKFNQRTGNYMLLDFGMSVMSDEQRRTSIRYAGAVEFMAPEQSTGDMLFETDIYSFGIIIFELLSGSVPFPLYNKGEMARNAVMLAHMESPPPDLLSHRRLALPGIWSSEKKEKETMVPTWLLEMIARCLEKSPGKRFKNGTELRDYIHSGIMTEAERKVTSIPSGVIPLFPLDESKLEKQIQELESDVRKKDHQITELKYQVGVKDNEIYQLNMEYYNQPARRGISGSAFYTVFLIALGLGAYNIYYSFIKPYQDGKADRSLVVNDNIIAPIDSSSLDLKTKPVKKGKIKPKKTTSTLADEKKLVTGKSKATSNAGYGNSHLNKYRVTSPAFFYGQPDKKTRNNYYVTVSDAILTSLEEKNDFVYVEFISSQGKPTKGWLSKKDLVQVSE